MEIDRDRCLRPSAFDRMEGLVREMHDPESGIPLRTHKLFLTNVPACFMGYDIVDWLAERLNLGEAGKPEAANLANQFCHYGYVFPVSESKVFIKDDNNLYRLQSQMYWPWQKRPPDNVEYAIYLTKRTLRNKQRHALDEHELEMLTNLRKNLANKWEFITSQAEEQIKQLKGMKKSEKAINDSRERAYWRIHRPPPGMANPLEQCPVPTRPRNGNRTRKRTIEDCKREVEMLKNSLSRTRIKVSQALESMVQYVETYSEYDPFTTAASQSSNPWINDDLTYWQLNSPIVDIPTEKRVKRWALSMEELVSDPTGLNEFTAYLRKEYSHENIRFWMAVNDLRRSSQSQIQRKVYEIFEEFLAPGAPCEINIDGKTMEKVHQEMKNPSRFTFDAAQEHVYTLLLKKDCYPRFIRSEQYKNLLAAGSQPLQKKRFFGFGPAKKKSNPVPPNPSGLLQQAGPSGINMCGALNKRRGSDRSLSGSAHELAVSGVRDTRVPHSHSQSNLSDIPYRAEVSDQHATTTETDAESSCRMKKPGVDVIASTSEDVCPWECGPEPTTGTSRSRKNSAQLDSGSSSSDISVTVADVSDRLRRQCGLTQQYTLDGDRRGQSTRKLSTASYMETRRASVSALMGIASASSTLTRESTLVGGNLSDRPVVPSSEEYGCNFGESLGSSVMTLVASGDSDTAASSSSANKQTATLADSVSTGISATAATAPIISVSSVTDDREGVCTELSMDEMDMNYDEEEEEDEEEEDEDDDDDYDDEDDEDGGEDDNNGNGKNKQERRKNEVVETEEEKENDNQSKHKHEEIRKSVSSNEAGDNAGDAAVIEKQTFCSIHQQHRQPQQQQLQLAPLAVPDCESPVSEIGLEEQQQLLEQQQQQQHQPPQQPSSQSQSEAKSNDVCPWEDEENCKVDAPFVKTYATLGYL